ncbi:hypothetical protein IWX90DRAFT_442806 [Phyllosticta citrichinensis]|uniref:Secreted protein n=1 Tax=Phyllosticta citrichinensis TaxID=1130410 RepID=A0ABR1XIA0_9PEZI
MTMVSFLFGFLGWLAARHVCCLFCNLHLPLPTPLSSVCFATGCAQPPLLWLGFGLRVSLFLTDVPAVSLFSIHTVVVCEFGASRCHKR